MIHLDSLSIEQAVLLHAWIYERLPRHHSDNPTEGSYQAGELVNELHDSLSQEGYVWSIRLRRMVLEHVHDFNRVFKLESGGFVIECAHCQAIRNATEQELPPDWPTWGPLSWNPQEQRIWQPTDKELL